MMGRNHSLLAAAVWLAAGPETLALAGTHVTPSQTAAGVLLCAGAGLLPDVDHPQATIAHTLGPITQIPCQFIGAISGGHRNKTHTILFCVLMGFAAAWIMRYTNGLLVMYTVFAVWALRLLGPKDLRYKAFGGGCIVTSLATGWWVTQNVAAGPWVPLAVTYGSLAHLLGDCLTNGGAPILWPFTKKRFFIRLIDTNNWVEQALLPPLFTAIILTAVWMRFPQISGMIQNANGN